jgi:large subunit ribosomal protein L32e
MNFLRRTCKKIKRLGRGRKKKQVWRRPAGRDNKMRDKRRGYPAVVSIGYGSEKKSRGKINNLVPLKVNNLKDLEKIGKNNIAIIGKIGKKKRMDILKKAKEMKIEVANFNLEKIDKKMEKKKNESK